MKLRGFFGGVVAGGVVAGVTAFAVMREVRRKRDVEVFGDAVAKVTGDILRSVTDILNPPAQPQQWDQEPWSEARRMRTRETELPAPQSSNGQATSTSPTPWYLGGPDDIPEDADLDPTDLNTPLDRVQPMQPGSIGPVLQGGIFDEPMPEGDWDQDRRGPRTVAYDHDENPLRDVGLVAPVTDIEGGGT